MSGAASLLYLCTALLLGQNADRLIYQAPAIEVWTGSSAERDPHDPDVQQNRLMYYTIYWGRQYLRPATRTDRGDPRKDFSRLPTTYWHPHGPLGAALARFNWFPAEPNTFHADARIVASLVGQAGQPYGPLAALWSEPPVAVLGMNVGTQAGYARPLQTMHFFERDPNLIAVSQPARGKPLYFRFITDARQRGAQVKVFPGEHRDGIAKHGGDRFYHVIDIECIKEGADEKLHEDLLTKEAMQLLMSKVVDDGLLCFHTSHRHVDLDRLIGSVAKACGYTAVVASSQYDPKAERGLFSSQWVIVARKRATLDRLRQRAQANFRAPALDWRAPQDTSPGFVWRDGAKNSLAGLWRSDPEIFALRNRIHGWVKSVAKNASNRTIYNLTRPIDDVLDGLNRASVALKNRDPNPPPRPAGPVAPIEVRTAWTRTSDNGPILQYQQLLYYHTNIGIQFARESIREEPAKPNADLSRLPTTYYHPNGPAGRAFALWDWFPGPPSTHHADARLPASLVGLGGQSYAQLLTLWAEPPVAVLGLEIGTPAAYARPFQTMLFTEREPAIRDLSLPFDGKSPAFTYVRNAMERGANVQVFAGEPRPTFAKHGGAKFYRLILVELIKGDIRYQHEDLLTREGMAMLMSKLHDDGILCYHTSNRYYNLVPIVAAAARDLGYACIHGADSGDWRDEPGHFTSDWVMVARKKELLQRLKEPPGYAKVRRPGDNEPYWKVPDAERRRLWKDGAEHSYRGLVRSDPFAGDLRRYVSSIEEVIERFAGFNEAHRLTEPLRGVIEGINRRRVEIMNR